MFNRMVFKLFVVCILLFCGVYGCGPAEREPVSDAVPIAEAADEVVEDVIKSAEPVEPIEAEEPVAEAIEAAAEAVADEAIEEVIKSAELRLSFAVGDVSTYKVVTVSRKKYKYEEPANDEVTEKNTETKYEVIFTQTIEGIDVFGAATANIVINEVKVRSADRSGFVTSFNTSEGKDPEIPLMKLVGQSYKIKITNSGAVEVVDATGIQAAADGSTVRHKISMGLVEDGELIKRHEVFALPDAVKTEVEVGEKWGKLKNSPPGMLQGKTFKLIYSLGEVKNGGDTKVAVVDMEAIPSEESLEDMPEGAEGMGPFMNMFDIQESYTGRLTFDLNSSRVVRYAEHLQSDWVAVEPVQGDEDGEFEPSALTMGFEYDYSVERLD